MSTRARIAITVVSTLAVAASSYGGSYGIAPSGPLGDLLDKSLLLVYVLAVVGAFVINRWWALLPAVAPVAVNFYLYNLTDYSTPWDSEGIGIPNGPVAYGVLLLLGVCLWAAPFALAVGARRFWEWARSERRARSGTGG